MTELVSSLPDKLYNSLCEKLAQEGYHEEVHDDEIHAYMSTGLGILDIKNAKKYIKPFKAVFKKYSKDLKL